MEAGGPRLVIVGTGHGARVHLPAAREAGFEVVALVGTQAERIAKIAARNGVPHAFTDLAEAIAATGAQAVTIATPPVTHAPLVATAAAQGCHIYCEKPFAMDAAEAARMRDAADAAGVVHVIGNQLRMRPSRVALGQAIADGRIGAPRLVTLILYTGMLAGADLRMPGWWYRRDEGGGWLGASGSHMIDMVRSCLGEFASVSAVLPTVSARVEGVEDSLVVRFGLANGAEGMIQQSGGTWGPTAEMTRIAGDNGTLWVEGDDAWLADDGGARRLEVPAEMALPEMAPSDDPRKRFLHIELPPSVRLMQAWRAAIERRPFAAPPYATFADGAAAMAVIDAIRRSAAAGGGLVRL